MIFPPEGSNIRVDFEDGHQQIVIPYKSGGAQRWLHGLSILLSLCFFVIFLVAFLRADSGGSLGPGWVLWLGLWALSGIMGVWTLYRMFRPSVPEALILTKYEMLYDSGVAPLAYPFSPKSQREYWEKMFERRVKTSLSLTQLNTLRLRESQTGNRLTIDDGSKRIEIAAGAGEPDREWLFDVLCRYYNLPHEVKKPEPTVDNPSIASALLEKPRRKRTKRNTWQCPYCKTPTRIEAEGGKKWQVCDGCGWSGAVKE